MMNPFKFGTIVESSFFTDRRIELQQIKSVLNSENHLILISPRRFGKTSLVVKALQESERKHIMINLQSVVSVEDFASRLLKEVFKIYKFEKLKYMIKNFRVVPTLSINPMTDGVDVAIQPMVDSRVMIEDVFSLLQMLATENDRLIVVFDEFQEIKAIDKNLDRVLRSIIQLHKNINYLFLGSQESMMREIFEKKKSPFFHFGQLLNLDKIPYEDFKLYLYDRLSFMDDADRVCDEILDFTKCHPYYTQQLASQVWEKGKNGEMENIVEEAINRLLEFHDLNFERIWLNFNNTDKRILIWLANNNKPYTLLGIAQSTISSSLKRMLKDGYVIKTTEYEVEDPFFRNWILSR
ncbi:MAG: ATP-binding protein [Paludibacteraceae bacterium]|nr:ATP-binding protein [Paludibacteraceae bacterium]